MAVGIAHAYSSENKNKYGVAGDQLQSSSPDKKGEIRVGDWYKRSGGWNVYLECTDAELAKKAAEWAVKIANDKNYGYSQGSGSSDGRWSGYRKIKAEGFGKSKGAFDCSSLIISCYIFAGCPNLKPTGYTGSMVKLLMATGKFKKYTTSAYVDSSSKATLGGVYVAEGAHTVMVVDATAPATKVTELKDPYVLVSGSVNVRKAPGTSGKILMVARKGNKLPYTGTTKTAANGTAWYQVETEKGTGYISGFTNSKRKYTKLITNV